MSGVGHASDPGFLVLHGLRLKGVAEPEVVGAAVGIDTATVAQHLGPLRDDELVVRREGLLVGWSLTPSGRQRQEQLAVKDVADAGAAVDVRGAYEAFLAVNGELLATCTEWQLRNGVVNDHADAAHDAAVMDRLRAVDAAARPVVARLADRLDRYRPYRGRFAGALERVEAGEHDYVARPVIDSYHTVWFELHEDLLTSLGLDRSKEGSPDVR